MNDTKKTTKEAQRDESERSQKASVSEKVVSSREEQDESARADSAPAVPVERGVDLPEPEESVAAPPDDLEEIQIDPEFQDLIPSASKMRQKELETQLQQDRRCRDKLVVWKEKKILLDGHNRLAICRKHNLEYEIEWVSLPDRQAAKQWIIRNQLARRNLTPEGMSYLRGTMYEIREKKQGQRSDLASGSEGQKKGAAEELAGLFGVDERTIRRDGDYAHALDALAQTCGEEIRTKILTKEVRLIKQDVARLLKELPNKQKEIVAQVLVEGKWKKPASAKPTPAEGFKKRWQKLKDEDRRTLLLELLADQDFESMLQELRTDPGEATEVPEATSASDASGAEKE